MFGLFSVFFSKEGKSSEMGGQKLFLDGADREMAGDLQKETFRAVGNEGRGRDARWK